MNRHDTGAVIHRLEYGKYLQLLLSRRPLRRALPVRIKEEVQRWLLIDVRSGQLFAPQVDPQSALSGVRALRETRE